MILVDDHLARGVVLGERLGRDDGVVLATTWGMHFRLVRALTDRRSRGMLSQGDVDVALDAVVRAEDNGLHVVDPRVLTATAARLGIEHRLNLLTAELVAAAIVHDAEVVLTERNVGKRWPALFDDLGIALTVV